MPVRKVSDLIAELMELERNDPPMYYFAMELLVEHLLKAIKEIIKCQKESLKKKK